MFGERNGEQSRTGQNRGEQGRTMELDNELVKFNPYRCKALGLTEVEARCLNFVPRTGHFVRLHTPLHARMKQMFPTVYEKLERRGLIEPIGSEWRLTEAGRSKLRVLLEGK